MAARQGRRVNGRLFHRQVGGLVMLFLLACLAIGSFAVGFSLASG